MSENSNYLVPAETISVEQEIKKSRFITTIGRASSTDEAKTFIDDVSSKYSDASHNCYAFIAGDPEGTMEVGMSDDGEVPGTAAKPMMQLLKHRNIGEVVVVVTRYFGGTKLGTGGLVRAYSDSVQTAIEGLTLEERVEIKDGSLDFPYSNEGDIRHIFDELNVKIKDVSYTQNVTMKISAPEHNAEQLENRIADLTSGEVKIAWSDPG